MAKNVVPDVSARAAMRGDQVRSRVGRCQPESATERCRNWNNVRSYLTATAPVWFSYPSDEARLAIGTHVSPAQPARPLPPHSPRHDSPPLGGETTPRAA